MKKPLYLLLLVCSFAYSQEKHIFTVGIDTKLAIAGAYDYDDTPVLDIFISAVSQVNKNEIGIICEYAQLNPYYWSFGFMYNRLIPIFNTDKIETLLGAEVIVIQRGFKPQVQNEFLAYGLNATTRIYLVDFLSINLKLNAKYRTDLAKHYNTSNPIKISGYASLSYIINRW